MKHFPKCLLKYLLKHFPNLAEILAETFSEMLDETLSEMLDETLSEMLDETLSEMLAEILAESGFSYDSEDTRGIDNIFSNTFYSHFHSLYPNQFVTNFV